MSLKFRTSRNIFAAISAALASLPGQAALNFEDAPVFRLNNLIDSKTTWMEQQGLATCQIMADEIFVFSCKQNEEIDRKVKTEEEAPVDDDIDSPTEK